MGRKGNGGSSDGGVFASQVRQDEALTASTRRGRVYTGPPVSLKFSRPTRNDPLATLSLLDPSARLARDSLVLIASVSTAHTAAVLFKRSQMVLGIRDGFVRLETVFSPSWPLRREVSIRLAIGKRVTG